MLDPELDPKYKPIFDAAVAVLQRNYHPVRHSVGAAVLTASGNIYTGVNIESSGHGVCAEPVALGAAISCGEREFFGNHRRLPQRRRLPGGFRRAETAGRC